MKFAHNDNEETVTKTIKCKNCLFFLSEISIEYNYNEGICLLQSNMNIEKGDITIMNREFSDCERYKNKYE